MLEVTAKEGLEDIVSWCPHGRAFAVWKPTEFVDKVLLRCVYFDVTREWSSCDGPYHANDISFRLNTGSSARASTPPSSVSSIFTDFLVSLMA